VWSITATDGTPPYSLTWDWGDGKTAASSSNSTPWHLTIAHQYLKTGNYQITIRATDAAGSHATLNVVATVSGTVTAVVPPENGEFQIAWPYYLLLLLLILAFWIEEHYHKKQTEAAEAELALLPPAERKKRLSRAGRITAIVAFFGVVGLVCASLFTTTSGPVHQYESILSRSVGAGITSMPASYQGPYISFTYPSSYQLTSATSSNPYLQVINLVDGSASALLGITIQKAPSLNASADVTRRLAQTQRYTWTRIQANGNNGYVFTDHDNGLEQTIFIQHGGLVVGFAPAGPKGNNLNNQLNEVINSLQWH
jgi:hypothetical protein